MQLIAPLSDAIKEFKFKILSMTIQEVDIVEMFSLVMSALSWLKESDKEAERIAATLRMYGQRSVEDSKPTVDGEILSDAWMDLYRASKYELSAHPLWDSEGFMRYYLVDIVNDFPILADEDP